MPKSCSAYNCTNRYNSKNPELTFHRFPLSKPHLLQEWLENIGRADFCPKRHMVICSQHFTPESFSSYGNRKNLTWNAVPTLFNATQGQPKVRRYGKLLKQLKNDPDPSPVTPTTPVAPAGEESRQCSRCQGVEPVKGEQDRSQPPHTQVQIRSQAGPEPASTHTGTDQESSRTRASLHTPRYRSGVKQDRSQPPHTQVQIRSQAGPEPASTHTHRYRSGVKQDQSQPPHTQVQIRSQAGPEPASTHTHRYRSGVKQDRSQPPHTQVQIRSQAGPEPASTHTAPPGAGIARAQLRTLGPAGDEGAVLRCRGVQRQAAQEVKGEGRDHPPHQTQAAGSQSGAGEAAGSQSEHRGGGPCVNTELTGYRDAASQAKNMLYKRGALKCIILTSC
ncbi:peroxynitrite isomerase THAP4-like isoform X2 [Acipenser ruthenus]|uniref:peroxynitrite isomerase THAP4-like isoform X2 n=1 Tax=Acipenser ruthenus TaxID=7906 RepID=UPI0027411D95|nr:peroxynitrite isomerase THAP4-like isoform X2 [Acipenser ruthenus]